MDSYCKGSALFIHTYDTTGEGASVLIDFPLMPRDNPIITIITIVVPIKSTAHIFTQHPKLRG